LPEGVYLEWAGEYGELTQAIHRLEFVVPFSLVLIAAVLYGANLLLDRHIHHHGPGACRLPPGNPGAFGQRHSIQLVGAGRLHLDLRHRGDGWHPRFQSLSEPWPTPQTHTGKLIMTVFAGIAEFERDPIR
jgi:hypothetical protein